MMKKIAFICLILAAGCADRDEIDAPKAEWKIQWSVDGEQLDGEITLFNNNYAHLDVEGKNNSLLLSKAEDIDFLWQLTDKHLTLKRLDNNIELKYEILAKTQDYIELSYASDISVKLYRQ